MADSPSGPEMPRWVKMFGIAAIVLVVLFAVAHLTMGGLGHRGH